MKTTQLSAHTARNSFAPSLCNMSSHDATLYANARIDAEYFEEMQEKFELRLIRAERAERFVRLSDEE